MRFIKYHWFNLLMVFIILSTMFLTLLIALAPKEDNQERGFIPCTKQLSENLLSCETNFWCIIKGIFANSLCDLNIIQRGLQDWIKGQQAYPWSNYYFVPDLTSKEEIADENLSLFYEENPNYKQDFEQVKLDHQKLEEMRNDDSKTEEK